MKSSLRRLRGFALHNHDGKEKRDFQPSAQLDELAQASQDMEDMRNCYDSLLSAAAATANSAYEFSESLGEMGACLLQKTALNDDEDSGRVLLMLGKLQFELQKLVDSYRMHIIQTITTPSESLLNELRTVEEMKRQCDEKRNIYDEMMAALREKGRSKHAKEHISSQQLQTAHEEYDEEATLFVFRLKSLKQGQSRSLLTQAARHHAAQLNFFKKGLKSLEAVEPHVKLVAEEQHIDYQFSGLEDDEPDYGDYDEGDDANDDGELSFDYGQNDGGQEVVSTSRNSMDLDQVDLAPVPSIEAAKENLMKGQGDMPIFGKIPGIGSQSAPIFPDKKLDTVDMRPSSTRKFYTYVLPTPIDAMNSSLSGASNNFGSGVRQSSIGGHPQNVWHSSPLEPKKLEKGSKYGTMSEKLLSVLKESNVNSDSPKVPPPLTEGLSVQHLDPRIRSDPKKIKRNAFSGPLTSKAWSSKPSISSSGPISSADHPPHSATILQRVPVSQPSPSPKGSPTASPPLMSSPRISELHELPRPPGSSGRPTRPTSLIGHSAPLVSRSQEFSAAVKAHPVVSHTASPLPVPPGTVPRSFSIPSSGQRAMAMNVVTVEIASPPLTPISFTQAAAAASELGLRPGKPEGRID
ncbi:hypothetical protein H6P81_012411 [Aristolochia fimbriata]|uniref:Hydroxyproline-rich glycoprotein family protein n=1 Tax=Aristolochia fimbriata TaxID=158543 RepID=A0AAV7EGD0_ARIFI|nr:hypothetical protein H6P81_012411 [Aristolochia fimbriata]